MNIIQKEWYKVVTVSATTILSLSTSSKTAHNLIYQLLDYAASLYKHSPSLLGSYAGLSTGIVTFEFSSNKSSQLSIAIRWQAAISDYEGQNYNN